MSLVHLVGALEVGERAGDAPHPRRAPPGEGVVPDRPLGRDDIRGLPLTDKIWD